MAKFKYKKQLKNPIQKLYDGFIRANFFLNHIQENFSLILRTKISMKILR